MIEAQNLSKRYETLRGPPVEALNKVTLRIEKGQFASILGPSGCGKSTFLKVAAGLIPATNGQLRVGGEPELSGKRCATH